MNTMRDIHDIYQAHQDGPICECGRINKEFSFSECDRITTKGWEALLKSQEPVSFKLTLLGLGLYRTPKKIETLAKKYPKNKLLQIVMQEKQANQEMLDELIPRIKVKLSQETNYLLLPKWLFSLWLSYDKEAKLAKKFNLGIQYILSENKISIARIFKNKHSGIFGVFKNIVKQENCTYKYIIVKPRATKLKDYLKYSPHPEKVVEYLKKGIKEGVNWRGMLIEDISKKQIKRWDYV